MKVSNKMTNRVDLDLGLYCLGRNYLSKKLGLLQVIKHLNNKAGQYSP